jgi:Tfp pilus assembly protein PilF
MRAIRRGIGYIGLGLLVACATTDDQQLRQAESHRDLGALHLQRGEAELAIRQYRHAIKLNSSDAESHFGIGEAYRRKGEYDLAEQHLKEALRHDPGQLDSRLNLGALYIEQGRWEEAIEQNNLLLNDPTFLFPERALVNLGWAEYQSGDITAAEQHLREAVQVNRRSFQAQLNLGIVLYDQQEYVEAATHLEQVLRILSDRQRRGGGALPAGRDVHQARPAREGSGALAGCLRAGGRRRVGQAVSRVSPGDRVARAGEPAEAPFGVWFGRERRLRQVSVELVSIATRIPPERIDALEAGKAELPPNGASRAIARALASAIGADPDEAAARVGGYNEPSDVPRLGRALRRAAIALAIGLLVLGGAVGIWKLTVGGGAAAESSEEAGEEPGIVHRPDHLFRLLEEPEG